MRKYLLILLALVAALITVPQLEVHSERSARSRRTYAADEVLIKLKSDADGLGAPEQVLDNILPLGKRNARSIGAREAFSQNVAGGLYLVRLEAGFSVEDAISAAKLDPRVEYAEPNYLSRLQMVPNDTRFTDQWALQNTGTNGIGQIGADIGVLPAWDMTVGSGDLVVAVIDTGYDLTHPDLAANTWVNSHEVAGNSIDDDGNGFVDDVNGWNFFSDNNSVQEDRTIGFSEGYGHGTHVAGSIGAVGNNGIGVSGVAWNVKLMPLRIFGRDSDGEVTAKVSDIVDAINYVTDQRSRGVNVRVINASLGDAGNSNSFRNAIDRAGKQGILFVAAAGNYSEDNDETPSYPGAWSSELDTVISVAAINKLDQLASYSSYGHTTVDVAAPGGEGYGEFHKVYSTYPGGGYFGMSGTSQATPHVSGIAVLLWSREPSLNPAQIKERIKATAEPVLALSSQVASSGRANAYNALTNTVPAPGPIGLRRVETNKKFVYIDGLSFAGKSVVVEVNGVAQSGKVQLEDGYRLANGTYSRFRLKLGKSGVKAAFPNGTRVTVTVYDPATGQRTNAVNYTNFS